MQYVPIISVKGISMKKDFLMLSEPGDSCYSSV